jgi:ATP/maltotriose-dependent transcriptional regulator MalT
LNDLEQDVDASPDHLLRLGQAKLVVAEREGHLSEALANAIGVEPLLDQVSDPFIRSGFLNNLSHAFGMAAHYAKAEDAARRQMDEATHFRLTFAFPAALTNLAVARVGLGELTAAAADVERAKTELADSDSALRIKLDIVQASITLARGDCQRAAADLQAISVDDGRPDLVCEAFAVRAVAEAAVGDSDAADASIRAAKTLPADVAPRVFVAAALAILACANRAPVVDSRLTALAAIIEQTGCYDSLVCALRASPSLLELSLEHSEMKTPIRVAALRSGDVTLAQAAGVSPRKTQAALTTREIDVLALVAQGFSNAEIGTRLFISPKTVKTHLQNIYEKFDVRSRTEAAMKAKAVGLLS